ncbi:MAG TPA: NAD-dependent epimerase/dehydratase family protein [Fibrobacteria bacterium]|nr:NAD-dependent epimerase/dehydratase family protein [Fibrobacteria bacterium]
MILVTGGAGNMGRRLALALAKGGSRVRILCLPGDPAAAALADASRPEDRVQLVFGDITRKESLPSVLAGVETVFHLAAVLLSPGNEDAFRSVNAEGTRNLVEAAEAAGAGHFIYVSSISVAYPKSNAYARSKLRGEEWVKRSKMPYTIVRPSLAYEDRGALEFMAFVDHLRRGPVVLLPAGGRARKSPVHIEDLVAGFLALPGNPRSFGKTYAFSGGDVVSLREMAQALLAHMGRPKPIVGVPASLCLLGVAAFWALAKLAGLRTAFTYQTYTGLVQDAAPSHREAAEDLGYRPRPFREGLAALESLRNCLGRKASQA